MVKHSEYNSYTEVVLYIIKNSTIFNYEEFFSLASFFGSACPRLDVGKATNCGCDIFAPWSKAKTMPSGVEAYPTPPGVWTNNGNAWKFGELPDRELGEMLTDTFVEERLLDTINGKEELIDAVEFVVTLGKLFITTFLDDKIFGIWVMVVRFESDLHSFSTSLIKLEFIESFSYELDLEK